MYLSRMVLDVQNRRTMQAFVNPNLFHGAVESAFCGERKRNLWRIDTLNGQYYLLLLSEEKPDLSDAVSSSDMQIHHLHGKRRHMKCCLTE